MEMRETMRVALAIALAGCPSGTYHSEGSRPPGWCPTNQDGVTWVRNANNECADPREGDRTVYRIEPPKRDHVITEERGIDGVAVHATPIGAAAWSVSIENNADSAMSVLWDESSFVVSSGEAAGRLIRGETRKLDTGKAQPPEPIPAHAKIVQVVFAEKLLSVEETEEKWQGADLRMAAITEARSIRAKRNALLVGGRLHLTLDVAGAKKTWTGIVVSNVAAETPASRGPVNPLEEMIAKVDGFRARMCACVDKACAEKTQLDLEVWGKEPAAERMKNVTPDDNIKRRSAEIMTKYVECQTRLMQQ